MNKRAAFSLVELSIVLVILGLLVGGVLAGQSLIRASQLRAVSTEHQRYITAMNSFRDRYFALPGDFANATRVWGQQSDGAAAVAFCSNTSGAALSVNGACDGNGNNLMNNATGSATGGISGEKHQAWRQLALAGLIEGTFTGLSNPDGTGNGDVAGSNAPQSKLGPAGWSAEHRTGPATYSYAIEYGNSLMFGTLNGTNSPLMGAAIRPVEAWNIDSKIDDGKPGRGRVIARFFDTCADSMTNSDLDGDYRLSNSAIVCAFFFPRAF